ncbi:MAG: hypothetical protein WA667_24985, partial [Candidatus Nitrosopolaris sp.]
MNKLILNLVESATRSVSNVINSIRTLEGEDFVVHRLFPSNSTSDFDSPIPKLLTHSSNSVTKLTDQKIRWIIREKMKEILSTNDIALLQNVSESRIRQIWCQYRNTMTVPILAKPGRPSRSITNEE